MMKPRAGVSLALAILAVAIVAIAWGATVSAGADDVIRFRRLKAGERANVIVDGLAAAGCVNDEPHAILVAVTGPVDISIGNMTPGPCRSEIATFAIDHAMRLVAPRPVTTRAGDVVPVDTPPRLKVPLTIRILQTPFMDWRQKAAEEIAHASFLYNVNAGGVMFSPINFVDMTTTAGASAVLFNDCFNVSSFTSLGFTGGRLNVYYTNQLGTTTARGHYCRDDNPNVILIPTTFAELDTLAHELGHGFSLDHTNAIDPMTGLSLPTPRPGLAPDNLMLTKVSNRSTLTNGQVFRANTNSNSMLNKNRVRSGSTRACPDTVASDSCPALALDLVPK